EMLEAFIKKFPTSTKRPGADSDLVDTWAKNNDNTKILAFAEEYKKNPPSPDPAAKAKIFSQAALVAYSNKDVPKAAEFGEAAIQADPTHFQSLYFMAAAGLPDPNKALEYAQKALAMQKPANVDSAAYDKNMARLHNLVALP